MCDIPAQGEVARYDGTRARGLPSRCNQRHVPLRPRQRYSVIGTSCRCRRSGLHKEVRGTALVTQGFGSPNRRKYPEISLWWHVSNHHFARGGPLISPVIGDLEELRGDLLFERLRDAFLIGILVIMALYHLGIFSQRTKDTTSLWFGLLCLAVAIRQISTSRFIEILSQPASSAQFESGNA